MNKLHHLVNQYLEVRRGLGYKLEREGRWLPDFVSFIERGNVAHITAVLALEWATASSQASTRWWGTRLSAVRQFARFANGFDPRHEVPSTGLLPATARSRRVPYIYSNADIQCLMARARCLQGFKARTYATLFGLLYTTGMRVGEAIRLQHADLDWQQGMLTIHHAKFDKSRQIPLHSSTVMALRRYALCRKAAVPCPRDTNFLLSLAGTQLHYKNVHVTFMRLLRSTSLAARRPERPRLHDLRHSFAIRTLTQWQQQGLEVEARLPALSTYLGHVNPSSTYWYLQATVEMLGPAAERLDHALGMLP
jgi:integrase/recombinase XerD